MVGGVRVCVLVCSSDNNKHEHKAKQISVKCAKGPSSRLKSMLHSS